jgi:hypothetical protein
MSILRGQDTVHSLWRGIKKTLWSDSRNVAARRHCDFSYDVTRNVTLANVCLSLDTLSVKTPTTYEFTLCLCLYYTLLTTLNLKSVDLAVEMYM